MNRMATERLKTPSLFACAARVTIPQVGSQESDTRIITGRFAPESIVFKSSSRVSEPVRREYLKTVAAGLQFEEDVVRERCFHALPYDEKYMYEVFDIGDLVSLPPKTRMPVGRHSARGSDLRHMPCNLPTTSKKKLKPLKKRIMEKALHLHQEALLQEQIKEAEKKKLVKAEELETVSEDSEVESKDGIFLTEVKGKGKEKEDSKQIETEVKKPAQETKEEPSEKETEETIRKDKKEILKEDDNEWDSYLMSIVSSNTANWIVYEKTPVGSKERERLAGMLEKWYGGPPEHTDLIRETTSDNEMDKDEDEKVAKPKKKWKKKEATLLERVYNIVEAAPHANDPYSDENKAPFYRQPAGLRRAKKTIEKEEAGAINSTAANIEVKSYTYPPPPTLRDFMNPKVGDKILDTDNMYQQELLTGTQQHLQPFGDKTKILMENNNKYKKQFQSTFPPEPQEWYPETDEEKEKKADIKQIKKYERGHKRWKGLPEPVDDTADIVQYMLPDKEFQKSADPRARKTAKSNQSLMQINVKSTDGRSYSRRVSNVLNLITIAEKKKLQQKTIFDEWRTKWHLTGQYADSNPDDLIRDMADIQPHVRLKAIATAAKAAEYRPPPNQGIQLDYMGKEAIEPEHVPERLIVAIECLLDDTEDKIRMVAAITLYSLNRPTQRATDILYNALQSETPIDRWAAAQCLAHFGVCDSDVIGEILRQVMTTENTIKHERGISILGKISVSSDKQNGLLNLVHSMVAEQLNSSSWRHKVIACKILPTLHGDINKDITNKLADLMWNDWNAEVRHAAAQCLGKTGHGRDVHDDLRERILNGDERIKLEAISKVGQLGIMTAKLLPVFLECFEDDYVSIRREVCITCGNLEIREDSVIEKLIHTATFDTVWKIKALAFQALGKIGVVNDAVVDCLLWAVRYEENPGVRAEAAHTLNILKVKTENVAEVLQDRFLVESNQLVRDEIASALKIFDISATEDMDMVAQIKKEVHKLGTRNIIATQIVLNEKDEERQQNMDRMIARSETETKIIRIFYRNLVPKHMRYPRSIHFREPLVDVKVFSQGKEEKKESIMDRIRAMSRAESRSLTPTHKTPTVASPELGREGIVFTPTADKELEAILSREDVTTPATTEPSSSGLKLRTETGSSGEVGEESLTEKGDEEGDGSSQVTHTPSESTEGEEVEPELDEMKGEKLQEKDKKDKLEVLGVERPSSTVRFAPHLEVTDIPARITTPLGPSRLSLMGDVKGSRLSTAGFASDRGTVFSRDAIKEREKINAEARNAYAGLDDRYSDMIDDLEKVDNTFGEFVAIRRRLSAEHNAEENRKNNPVKVLSLPKIELTADEVFDVESNDSIEEVSNDKSEDDKSATILPAENKTND